MLACVTALHSWHEFPVSSVKWMKNRWPSALGMGTGPLMSAWMTSPVVRFACSPFRFLAGFLPLPKCRHNGEKDWRYGWHVGLAWPHGGGPLHFLPYCKFTLTLTPLAPLVLSTRAPSHTLPSLEAANVMGQDGELRYRGLATCKLQ